MCFEFHFLTADAFPPPLHGSVLRVCSVVLLICRTDGMCDEVLVAIVRMPLVTKAAAVSAVELTVYCMWSCACINLYVHGSAFRKCTVMFFLCSVCGICEMFFVIVCMSLVTKTAAISAVALRFCIEASTCTNVYRIAVYGFEYCMSILIYFSMSFASLSWVQTVLSVFVFCTSRYPFFVKRKFYLFL